MARRRKRLESWLEQTIVGNLLDLRIGMLLFVLTLLIGMLGYMSIEDYTWVEAIYMAMITISTVGFTEVRPLSDAGRLFTTFYILLNIGVFAYALSAFTYFVIQGELFKKIYYRIMNQHIQSLEGHVIVCGYGRYGKEIVEHFITHNQPFVIIEADEHEIDTIRKSDHKIFFVHDDATHEEALEAANIKGARSLIAAMGSDAANMFTVLSARTIKPDLNIISRSFDQKSTPKLKLAGANHVIMPELIGGFYMAMLINKPRAIEFFTFITNENVGDVGFEELDYDTVPASCRNKSIKDLKIRQESGTNIIGFRRANGQYVVNPGPDERLTAGTSFIVLGSEEQITQLKKYISSLG